MNIRQPRMLSLNEKTQCFNTKLKKNMIFPIESMRVLKIHIISNHKKK